MYLRIYDWVRFYDYLRNQQRIAILPPLFYFVAFSHYSISYPVLPFGRITMITDFNIWCMIWINLHMFELVVYVTTIIQKILSFL
jgi:hypothetical protein